MAGVLNTGSLLSLLGWGVALLFFAAFLLFAIVTCVRRRRTKKRLSTMKRDLSEVQMVRAEYAKAQQSLVDYEEEKQLLLARLSHGGAECEEVVLPFSTAPRSRGGSYPGFAGCRRYKSLQEEDVFTGLPPFVGGAPPHSRMFLQSAMHSSCLPGISSPSTLQTSAAEMQTDVALATTSLKDEEGPPHRFRVSPLLSRRPPSPAWNTAPTKGFSKSDARMYKEQKKNQKKLMRQARKDERKAAKQQQKLQKELAKQDRQAMRRRRYDEARARRGLKRSHVCSLPGNADDGTLVVMQDTVQPQPVTVGTPVVVETADPNGCSVLASGTHAPSFSAPSSQVVMTSAPLPPATAGVQFASAGGPPSQPVVLVGSQPCGVRETTRVLTPPLAAVTSAPMVSAPMVSAPMVSAPMASLTLPPGTHVAASPLETGAPVVLHPGSAAQGLAVSPGETSAPIVLSPRGASGPGSNSARVQGCPETVRVVESTVVAPATPVLPPAAQQEETILVSEVAEGGGPGGALVAVEEERVVAQPIIRMGRETVIIPAHTFAPKLIFVGEQWLPAPTETHAGFMHSVPLAERARFSRKDPQKSESYARQVYAQVAANTVQFEKVLLSSKGTEKLCLTSADREHVRLQAAALTEILPSLQMTTSATEVQHMRYSLVDYSLASLSNINTQAIQQVVGDHCQQPIFAIVRVYEHTKLPDITPPPSPSQGCRHGAPMEDCDGWTLLYESPPVELGDRSRVSSGAIKMHEGARFYYKHRIVPPKPRLFDEEDAELHAVLPPKNCPSSPLGGGEAQLACQHSRPAVNACVDIAANTDPAPPAFAPRFPPFDPSRPPVLAGKKLENAEGTTLTEREVLQTEAIPPRQKRHGWGSDFPGNDCIFHRHGATSPSSREMERDGRLAASPGSHAVSPSLFQRGSSSCGVYTCTTNTAAARFRQVCLRQQGLLFENEVLAVSCVVGTSCFPTNRTLHASVELSIVCKKVFSSETAVSRLRGNTCGGGGTTGPSAEGSAPTGFHCVRTCVEDVERESLKCSVSPIVRAPSAQAGAPPRVMQTVVATVFSPFLVVPEVTLEVGLPDGSEHRCVFPLPVVLAQFLKPLQLSPAACMQLWFDSRLYSRLTSLRVSRQITACGGNFLNEVVTFNGRLALIQGVKHRLADNAVFAVGELAAIGDMEGDAKCIIRLSRPSNGGALAKIEVKASDARVAASVYELLVYLIEDEEEP